MSALVGVARVVGIAGVAGVAAGLLVGLGGPSKPAPVPQPQQRQRGRGVRVEAPSWAPSPYARREHRLGQPFAWAKEAERKQGRAFRDKLERVALSLRIDPSALATQMRHESGFSATIRNSIDAKGLIQFIPKTRRGLALKYGVVVSDDAVQQLDAVYYYYLEYKRRLGDWPPPVDVFFATFTSKGLRQPPGFIIFDRDDKAYHLNRGADRDNDGDIDVHESSERFRKYYRLGFAGPYYG